MCWLSEAPGFLNRACCNNARPRCLKTILNVHLDERFVFDEQDGVIVQPVHRNDLPGDAGPLIMVPYPFYH